MGSNGGGTKIHKLHVDQLDNLLDFKAFRKQDGDINKDDALSRKSPAPSMDRGLANFYDSFECDKKA